MKPKQMATCAAAAVGLVFGPLAVYGPNVSARTGGQVTFLSLSVQSPYSSKIARRLLVPSAPPEEPEWLIKAQNDPNPITRLNAIEAWARNPTDSLDPITYSLLDPDESVRAEAQRFLGEPLARQ